MVGRRKSKLWVKKVGSFGAESAIHFGWLSILELQSQAVFFMDGNEEKIQPTNHFLFVWIDFGNHHPVDSPPMKNVWFRLTAQ